MPGPVSGCTSPRGRAGRRGRPKEERRPEGWPGYWCAEGAQCRPNRTAREAKRWTALAPACRSRSDSMTALLTLSARCGGPCSGMEKLIVLAGLTAIVVFLATYALSAWREHR